MAEPSSDAGDRRRALLSRVAAVDAFHPTAVPGVTPAECMALVGRDVDVVTLDTDHTAWSLRLDVRQAALAAMSGPAEAREAAASLPARRATPVQAAFDRWLERGPDGIEPEHAVRIASWLALAPWAEGDVAKVRARAAEALRLDRLARLGGDQFVGRRRERVLLGGVLTGADPHRFVIVEGSGGMGKSSLLARVVLDVGGWRSDGPIAVAHVDYDDSEVDPRSDASLLRVVAAELAARLGGGLDTLAAELARLETEEETAVRATTGLDARARRALDSRVHLVADEVGRRVAQALEQGVAQRVVVLVDTFERAVRESPELAGRSLGLLWHVLEPLASSLVVCGRGLEAAARSLGAEVRPPLVVTLGELDRESSVSILRAQGVDEAVAARLATDLVDRPLTLRLAARALQSGRAVGAEERRAIQRALVDGYLHLRVLAHAADPRLRALLHPGLVLRQITPTLILEVLGRAPAPPVVDLADATRLFQALSRAHDLVTPAGDATGPPEVLVVRPEVRRELLPLVEHDRPEATRALHERAAAWYEGRAGLTDRAEAVYHLLALERLADAKARWGVELGPLLAGSLEELPVASREWLRIHLALDAEAEPQTTKTLTPRELPAPSGRGPVSAPELLAALDGPSASPEWDRGAARELEALLAARRLDAAGWLLAYWTERDPRSPLHAYAARYHRLAGQVDDAEREALLGLGAEPLPRLRSEMRRVLVWAAAQRSDVDEIERRVLEALVVSNTLEAPERLRALVDLAEVLFSRRESVLRRRLWSIEDEARAVFDVVSDATLRADRALASSSAAHLHDAKRLARCLALGAADGLRDPYLAGLAMALEALEPAAVAPSAGLGGAVLAALAQEAELLARASGSGAVITLVEGTAPLRWTDRLHALARMPERFVKWLLHLLERAAGEEAVVEAVREMIARDARAPDDADATTRTAALAALSRLVDAEVDAAQRADLARVLGGPTVLGPFEPSGPGLVSAADRCGQVGTLVEWLGDRVPALVERLAVLAEQLLRQPPFRHLSLERVLELWRALCRSGPMAQQGLGGLAQGLEEALVGPVPVGPPRPSHETWLLRALARMNETPRLLGGAPLEQFLAFASELPLGPEGARLVLAALDDLWARRGLGAPEPEAASSPPLTGKLRVEPASFLREGARAERGVAQLWVPRIEGGRTVLDASGKVTGLRSNAWRLARDLVVTSLFAVRARYPGDPIPDEDDLAAQVIAASLEGEPSEPGVRGLLAWSEALGYAVLEVASRVEPLGLRAEAFHGGPVSVLMHASRGVKRLVLSEARAAGRSDGRIEYLADASHGWLGAPLFDQGWRVLGVDWGARVREGAHLRFAWPITDVLADLRQRFPAVAARIPRGE